MNRLDLYTSSKSEITTRVRWNIMLESLWMDKRKLAALFSRFGPLDSGIKVGRDRNGVNFAVVTFRDGEAGLDCERAQNDGYNRKLKFNGRTLQIGYAAANETGNRRNNRSNWNQRRRS